MLLESRHRNNFYASPMEGKKDSEDSEKWACVIFCECVSRFSLPYSSHAKSRCDYAQYRNVHKRFYVSTDSRIIYCALDFFLAALSDLNESYLVKRKEKHYIAFLYLLIVCFMKKWNLFLLHASINKHTVQWCSRTLVTDTEIHTQHFIVPCVSTCLIFFPIKYYLRENIFGARKSFVLVEFSSVRVFISFPSKVYRFMR